MSTTYKFGVALVTAGVLMAPQLSMAEETNGESSSQPAMDIVSTEAQDAVQVADDAPEPGSPDNPRTLADLSMESSRDTRKAICGMVQEAAFELTDQMPITIDEATTMVKADTVYLHGICTYNLKYEVVEEELLQRLQGVLSDIQGEELPMDFVRKFYQTEGPGYAMMQDGLRQTLLGNSAFADVANIPFVEVRARFAMEGDTMDDFELLVGRHTDSDEQ